MHRCTVPIASCRRFGWVDAWRSRMTATNRGGTGSSSTASSAATKPPSKLSQGATSAASTGSSLKPRKPSKSTKPADSKTAQNTEHPRAATELDPRVERKANHATNEKSHTIAEQTNIPEAEAPKKRSAGRKRKSEDGELFDDQQVEDSKASDRQIEGVATDTGGNAPYVQAHEHDDQINAVWEELQTLRRETEKGMQSSKGTITKLRNELHALIGELTTKFENNLQQQRFDLEDRLYRVSNTADTLEAQERQIENNAETLQRNETALEDDVDSVAAGVLEAENKIASLQEQFDKFVTEKNEELKALWEDFRITHAEDSRRSDQLSVLLAKKEQEVEALKEAVENARQRQLDAEKSAAKLLCALKEAEFRAHQVEQKASLIVSGMSPYDIQAQPDENRAVRLHAMRDAALKAGAQSATSTSTAGPEISISNPNIGTFMLPQHHTVQLGRTSYLVNASHSVSEAEDDPRYEQFIQEAVANTLAADTELRTMTDTFEDIPTSELPEDLTRRLTPVVAASTATDTVTVAQPQLISRPSAKNVMLATEFRQRLPVDLSDTEPDQLYQQFLQEVVERIADTEANTNDTAGLASSVMDTVSTAVALDQQPAVDVSTAGTMPEIQGQGRETAKQQTTLVDTMAPNSVIIASQCAAAAYSPDYTGVDLSMFSSWGTADSVDDAYAVVAAEQVAVTQTTDKAPTQAASETPYQITASTSTGMSEGHSGHLVEGAVDEGLRNLTNTNPLTSEQPATAAINSSAVLQSAHQVLTFETASSKTEQEDEDEPGVQQSHIPRLRPDAIDKVFNGMRATERHSTGTDQDQIPATASQSPIVEMTDRQEESREAVPVTEEEEALAVEPSHIPKLRIEAIHDVFDTLRADECHASSTPALSPRTSVVTNSSNALPGQGIAAGVTAGFAADVAQPVAVDSHELLHVSDDESMDDPNQTGSYTGMSTVENNDEEADVTTHPVMSRPATQTVQSHSITNVADDESMDDITEVNSYPGVTDIGANDEEPDVVTVGSDGLQSSDTATASSSRSALTQPVDASHPEEAVGATDIAGQPFSMPMSMAHVSTSEPQAAGSEDVSSQQQNTSTADVHDTANEQSDVLAADIHNTASKQLDMQTAEAPVTAVPQVQSSVTDQQHKSQLDDALGAAADPSDSSRLHTGNPDEQGAEVQASYNEPTPATPALEFHANMGDVSNPQEPTPQQHVNRLPTVLSASVRGDEPQRNQDTQQQTASESELNSANTRGIGVQTQEEFAAALKRVVETAHSKESCVTPDMPRIEQPECMKALDGDEDDGSPLPDNLFREHFEDTEEGEPYMNGIA